MRNPSLQRALDGLRKNAPPILQTYAARREKESCVVCAVRTFKNRAHSAHNTGIAKFLRFTFRGTPPWKHAK